MLRMEPCRSLFVKTIDSNDPNVWRNGLTPSRWLMELSKPASSLFLYHAADPPR